MSKLPREQAFAMGVEWALKNECTRRLHDPEQVDWARYDARFHAYWCLKADRPTADEFVAGALTVWRMAQ